MDTPRTGLPAPSPHRASNHWSSSPPSYRRPLWTATLLAAAVTAQADTPPGWINTGNPSAYTLDAGRWEFSGTALAVNDTIDFLNVREDLLAGQQRLVGDSGDLSGSHLEVQYGITRDIALYAWQRQQDFTVDLGTVSSVNVVDIDDALRTRMQRVGARWTLWRGDLLNADNRTRAFAVELSAFRNQTDDFKVVVDQVRLPNLDIFFRDPTTFRVARLEDDGWQVRGLYTIPLDVTTTTTFWLGYGQSDATAATTSNVTSATVARLFEQSFEMGETVLSLGASVTIDLLPRMPLQFSYEYLNLASNDYARTPEVPAAGLPGFLTGQPPTETANHTFAGRLSYWVTPSLAVSLTGNLYSNQFLGILSHYNNPLSGSFASQPYGFAGLQLAFKL